LAKQLSEVVFNEEKQQRHDPHLLKSLELFTSFEMPQVSHHRALEIDLLEASLRSQHEYIASLDADHEDHGDLNTDILK